jgi:hypothetical protein
MAVDTGVLPAFRALAMQISWHLARHQAVNLVLHFAFKSM